MTKSYDPQGDAGMQGAREEFRQQPSELMRLKAENARLIRCIGMAMGCLNPMAKNRDQRLAWFRLVDAVDGKEPRNTLVEGE